MTENTFGKVIGLKRWKTLVLIFIILTGISLVGYILLKQQPGNKQGTLLRVAYLKLSNYDVLFIAKEKGYFEEEGLNADFILAATAQSSVDALLAGKIDMTTFSLFSLFALEENAPGKIKLASFQYSDKSGNTDTYRFIVKKDSDIHTLGDLEGRRIAVAPSYINVQIARLILRNFFSPDNVTLIQLPIEEHPSAVLSNSVDAALTLEPVATSSLLEGGFREIDNSVRARYIVDPFYAGAIVLSSEFIKNNPGVEKKVQRALARAIAFQNENDTEARSIIGEYTGYPKAVSDDMYIGKKQLPNEADKDALQKLMHILVENKLLKAPVDIDKMIIKE